MVITKEKPNRDYEIRRAIMMDLYFCYPKTEIQEMELLLCYNGNIINENLYISFHDNITELPRNLVVFGDLIINWALITEIPDDIFVSGDVHIGVTLINRDSMIPPGIKGSVFFT